MPSGLASPTSLSSLLIVTLKKKKKRNKNASLAGFGITGYLQLPATQEAGRWQVQALPRRLDESLPQNKKSEED